MPITWMLAAVLLSPLQLWSSHHAATEPHRQHHHRQQSHRHHLRRHASPQHYGVSRSMMTMVDRVNVCEEGGRWHVDGPTFYGGLGWLKATWMEFRIRTWPSNMADAPPYMQANAMWRFIWHYGIAMPDQQGCTGGY